jgi:adenine-specific DNA-methyltransferase
VFHLGLLMEQIFEERNQIATCVWQKRYSRESTSAIGDVHEYLLVYAICPAIFKQVRNRLSLDDKNRKAYSNPNNDPRGPWQSISFTGAGYRPNQMYQIVAPNGNVHGKRSMNPILGGEF